MLRVRTLIPYHSSGRAPPIFGFRERLADDPSVATYTHLVDTGTAQLYRMDWTNHVRLVVQMLTNANAIILDAAGTAAGWQLRVLYPDREDLRTAHDFCDDHNVPLDITTIRSPDVGPSPQIGLGGGLTDEQYEALVHAYNQGYFSVPRTVDLETLADDLNISHHRVSCTLVSHFNITGVSNTGKQLQPTLSGTVRTPPARPQHAHRGGTEHAPLGERSYV
jgi:hypothetical protein